MHLLVHCPSPYIPVEASSLQVGIDGVGEDEDHQTSPPFFDNENLLGG